MAPPTARRPIPTTLPTLQPWTIQHSNHSLLHHQLSSIHLSAPILLELSADAICHSPQQILPSIRQTSKRQADLQAPRTPTTHKHPLLQKQQKKPTHKHQLLQKQQKKKLKNHYILTHMATRQQSPPSSVCHPTSGTRMTRNPPTSDLTDL